MIRILLTAAFQPQSNFRLNLTDVSERRKQYGRALEKWSKWAEHHGVSIVLVENSGADLQSFVTDELGDCPRHLELLSAPLPHESTVARGKGASECLMMDLFARQFRSDPDDALWFKATGRLFVRNAISIIPDITSDPAFVVRLSLNLKHADARFFGATASVWREYFLSMDSEIEEAQDVRLEHVLAQRVCLGVGSGVDLVRLRGQPEIEGVSGTWKGRNYNGIQARVKRKGAGVLDYCLREVLVNKHY